ncbi:MAG: HAD-IC family P-type ATPase, partial [archaeon]|nr:HAD-IC family P-type ATPase [archaeon]
LTSAETLGSTSVIATDKTLTLTEGKMEVEEIFTLQDSSREEALIAASLANEAFIENPEAVFEQWELRGRPTDTALIRAGMEAGISKVALEKEFPLMLRIPFSTETKYIASFHKSKKKILAYVSGAPEQIIEQSQLSKSQQDTVDRKLDQLTKKGLRVVAIASTTCKELPAKEHAPEQLQNLTFIGIIALKDPLRKGVKRAIQAAKKAGIRIVIVTGDHVLTAAAVAQELGLKLTKKNILEGKELDTMSDKELKKRLPQISLFARVEPAHKLRIIQGWQDRGEVIAMTGDGINDAPALKRADIGLALGSGTDVAKEVSDLILLTDNFNILPAAIKEGRVILDNIR